MTLRLRNGRVITSRRNTLVDNSSFENLFTFQLKAAGIEQPERQHRFAAQHGREWRWDFAWPSKMIAVEIQGGIWKRGGGAHSHPTDILRNMLKYNAAAALGWRLLQFSTDQVKSGDALQYTERVLEGKLPDPL